jgi:hypothetical protein
MYDTAAKKEKKIECLEDALCEGNSVVIEKLSVKHGMMFRAPNPNFFFPAPDLAPRDKPGSWHP